VFSWPKEFNNRKFHTTAVSIAGRVSNPKRLRQGAMKKKESGDTWAYRSGNVLLMGSKDKRVMLMMSTYNDTPMEKMVTIQKGG
jgi:hypothetical protein